MGSLQGEGENLSMNAKKRRRVVLFPFPFQGHITPMLQLASILHSRGFCITVVHTDFNAPDPSNHADFAFRPISGDASFVSARKNDPSSVIAGLNEAFFGPFRDCLAGLLRDHALDGAPVACAITDAMWYSTQTVAEGLGVRRVVLRTSSLASFLIFDSVPKIRDRIRSYLSQQDTLPEDPVPELPSLKIKDIPKLLTQNPDGACELFANVAASIRASSGIIWNSFEDLEPSAVQAARREFPIPDFLIGPFHKHFPASPTSLLPQDRGSIAWLDAHPPGSVLYVSFGSVVGTSEPELLEVARGLASSDRPFLWVVRPGSVCGSEWLEALPKELVDELTGRGKIVKWAPQQEVLAHPSVGAFWTHNGWNSTLEGICEGVPMICSPNFGDQLPNARHVDGTWKIGVKLEKGLEREEIQRAIKRVMVDREGQEMRERGMCLKEKGHVSLNKGGSSYESLESLVDYLISLSP